MKYYNSVLDLIGNTPLVKLNKLTKGMKATVLAKIESLNPGGSRKAFEVRAFIAELVER